MPTLRERVRDALSAREPNERAARGDLEEVLARARGRKRGSAWRALVPALAFAGVIGVYVGSRRHEPAKDLVRASTSTQRVQLYLHRTGEPADQALTLDLTSKGEL